MALESQTYSLHPLFGADYYAVFDLQQQMSGAISLKHDLLALSNVLQRPRGKA